MELDLDQLRRFYSTGAIALPLPFPTVGDISILDAELDQSYGQEKTKAVVIVRERARFEGTTTRVILRKHVAAIFEYYGKGDRVDDFKNGKWRLAPIKGRGEAPEGEKGELAPGALQFRGIVFVPEYRPVLTIEETTRTAGSIESEWGGCECQRD